MSVAHSVRGGAGIQSNCSRPSFRCLDKFLTCKKLWLAIVRLSHNWNRACVDFHEVGCFSFTAPEQSGKKSIWKCGWKNIKYKGQVGFFFLLMLLMRMWSVKDRERLYQKNTGPNITDTFYFIIFIFLWHSLCYFTLDTGWREILQY